MRDFRGVAREPIIPGDPVVAEFARISIVGQASRKSGEFRYRQESMPHSRAEQNVYLRMYNPQECARAPLGLRQWCMFPGERDLR
jgi:hypothetical protein